MRFIFLSLFLLLSISVLSVLTLNTVTGNIANHAGCPGGHTYAFYRTLEEKTMVERAWLEAGFMPLQFEDAPDSFDNSGYQGFFCLRRMTNEERRRYSAGIDRPSVITTHRSV